MRISFDVEQHVNKNPLKRFVLLYTRIGKDIFKPNLNNIPIIVKWTTMISIFDFVLRVRICIFLLHDIADFGREM